MRCAPSQTLFEHVRNYRVRIYITQRNGTALIFNSLAFDLRHGGTLLRGESEEIARWLERWEGGRLWFCLAAVFAGAGLFGAALGAWRSPMQALYGGIKVPLVILLTTAGTVLSNAMMAPLLGLDIKFRQSLLVILFSHTIAAIIMGGFSPVLFFVVCNAPPVPTAASASTAGHSIVLLVEVALIAFAGVVANVRLRQLLDRLSGSPPISSRIMFAWLAANLFLGAQISWLMRPFVGSPDLPVEFLRSNAFQGNFYETVFRALMNLFHS